MTAARHRAEIAAQASLYGGQHPPRIIRQRAPHAVLADIEAGAQALVELVSRWRPMMPKAGEIVSAQTTVEGLRRLLADLQANSVNDPPAPNQSGTIAR